MFEQTELEVINEIINATEVVRYSKVSLNRLKKIKEVKTKKKDGECFCSNSWFKRFKSRISVKFRVRVRIRVRVRVQGAGSK